MSSKNRKLKEYLNHVHDCYEYGWITFQDKNFAKRQASKYYRRVQKKEITDGLTEYDNECIESINEECDRLYDEDLDMQAFYERDNELRDRYGDERLKSFWRQQQGDDDVANCIVVETPAELKTLDGEVVYLKYKSGKDSGYYRINGDSLIREAPSNELCVKKINMVFNNEIQVLKVR